MINVNMNDEAGIAVSVEQTAMTAVIGDLQAIHVGNQLMTIQSGIQEVGNYVEHTAKPALQEKTQSGIQEMNNYIVNTAQPTIEAFGQQAVEVFVDDVIKPGLETYITAAQIQANNAEGFALAASTCVSQAQTQAESATQQATSSLQSALLAQAWAESATAPAGSDTKSAKTWAMQANMQAENAAASAQTAQTQAQNASGSATAAAGSASAAAASAVSAQSQAEAADAGARTATQKATAAADSARDAATSALQAEGSAGEAATSAVQAATSAGNAAISATQAAHTVSDAVSLLENVNDVIETLHALETGKADKATTLSGYGIANAYTKTEVDNAFATNSALTSGLSGKQDKLSEAQLLAANSGITASKVSTYDSYATSKQDAGDYATNSALTSGLSGKQNNLSESQLLAVNSGITASKVSTYDGYATSKQDALPSQSGKEGMFLGTDGSNLLWQVSEGSYQAPLFSFQWSDHLLNDMSWLRADTFSWQDGSVYSTAYDHLVADIQGISSTTTQIAGVSISVYTASDGHKIVMSGQETAVQNIYNATGVAWFYILDTANHRFKLPRTKYGFTGLRTNVGEYVAPGLPNIRGSIQSNNWAGTASSNSALYPSGNGENSRAEGSGPNTISFDASRSSPIYGASTTVQPPATQMYLYFYIGNFTQTALAQTAGLNTELFNNKADVSLVNSKADVSVVNNKADVNLSNVNPSATFKTTVVGWSFPDYTAGVSIGSNYTAPSNGWIVVRTEGNGKYCYGGIDGAGYSVGGSFNNYHEDDTMFAPIRKGKVWIGSGSYTALFYPCVGG